MFLDLTEEDYENIVKMRKTSNSEKPSPERTKQNNTSRSINHQSLKSSFLNDSVTPEHDELVDGLAKIIEEHMPEQFDEGLKDAFSKRKS